MFADFNTVLNYVHIKAFRIYECQGYFTIDKCIVGTHIGRTNSFQFLTFLLVQSTFCKNLMSILHIPSERAKVEINILIYRIVTLRDYIQRTSATAKVEIFFELDKRFRIFFLRIVFEADSLTFIAVLLKGTEQFGFEGHLSTTKSE